MTQEQYNKILNALILNVQNGDSSAVRFIMDLVCNKNMFLKKEDETKDLK